MFCCLPLVPLSRRTSRRPRLDEIVVTATRMETTVGTWRVPYPSSTRSESRIGTQQLALDESLAGVPGLYMQNRYNFAQDLRISLRGFGARSRSAFAASKSWSTAYRKRCRTGRRRGQHRSRLDAAIEVLRGPASSLYGNASGGVIAIRKRIRRLKRRFWRGHCRRRLRLRKYQFKAGGQSGRLITW